MEKTLWEKHRALEKDNAKGSWKRLYLRRWEQEREVILEKISANRFSKVQYFLDGSKKEK